MYNKVLVPLDLSQESEGVLPLVVDLLKPGGEGMLLHVIPPGHAKSMGEFVQLASQVEEEAREKAMAYLRRLAGQFGDDSRHWSCAVSVSGSLPDEIVSFALRESVDLIAMYTHDRKGLAKLVKGSVADKVQKKASVDVKLFRPRELVAG